MKQTVYIRAEQKGLLIFPLKAPTKATAGMAQFEVVKLSKGGCLNLVGLCNLRDRSFFA